MGVWVGGWMDGWMDGLMDGWLGGHMNIGWKFQFSVLMTLPSHSLGIGPDYTNLFSNRIWLSS